MTFARIRFLRTIKNVFFSRSLGRFRGREAHRRVRTRDALHPSDSRGGQRRFEPSRVFPDRRSGGEKKRCATKKRARWLVDRKIDPSLLLGDTCCSSTDATKIFRAAAKQALAAHPRAARGSGDGLDVRGGRSDSEDGRRAPRISRGRAGWRERSVPGARRSWHRRRACFRRDRAPPRASRARGGVVG